MIYIKKKLNIHHLNPTNEISRRKSLNIAEPSTSMNNPVGKDQVHLRFCLL